MHIAKVFIVILFLLSLVLTKRKQKPIEPFVPLETMRRVTPELITAERDGSFDKQVVYITFRRSYVDEKGLLKLTNHLAEGLHNKHIDPLEYVQINSLKVGCVVSSITDMMEIKTFGKTRKSVLLVRSGEERILGAHVTAEEKEDYYASISGHNKKKKRKADVKEDL